MAALLALSAAPALAADEEEPAADETMAAEVALQRVEASESGLALAFPEDWRVSQPEGTRESPIRSAEDEPIYATTAFLANGGGGRWCDVDVFLDMTAPLDEHAYAYARYLQQLNSADVPMVVVGTELPAGEAIHIAVVDQARGRLRAMYLFDEPVAEGGTFDRYLLTCAAPPDAEPFWEAIAESAEVFEAIAAEDEESEDEAEEPEE